MERYFARCKTLEISDALGESLLRSVMYNAKVLLKEPENYEARSTIMWASSLSHNGVTGDRNYGDWACHQLEHELGGMFDIAHDLLDSQPSGAVGHATFIRKILPASHNLLLMS